MKTGDKEPKRHASIYNKQVRKKKQSKKEAKVLDDVSSIGAIDSNFIAELKQTRDEWHALFERFQNEGFIRKQEEPLSSKERFDLECADIAELRRRYLEDIFIKRYLPWYAKGIILFQKYILFPFQAKIRKLTNRPQSLVKSVEKTPIVFEHDDEVEKLNKSVAEQLLTRYMKEAELKNPSLVIKPQTLDDVKRSVAEERDVERH